MASRSRSDAGSPGTRTFLFADLHDYTEFVESHGDEAALALIADFRRLVRAAASKARGAEIKTEGDSFYIVFPSARDAVHAGIEILRSARDRDAARPPLRVGIGLHAGEPLPHERQFVGSAVNIAARLGAQARAGELLISDVVRGLLRTSAVPPMRERQGLVLKGVKDPPRAFSVGWDEPASEAKPGADRHAGPSQPVAVLPSSGRSGALPSLLTSFVGRRRELALLRSRWSEARLVTLTGPGGAGKTRLALELGRSIAERPRESVIFVDLSDVTDNEGVRAAVSSALDARRPASTTADGANTTLILDNCEHVVASCAELVQRLLSQNADLRVLATSREALDVAGETIWPVPPLASPSKEQVGRGGWTRFDALTLFAERARLVRPAFELDQASGPVVAEICRSLDGIPLAIELAASRLRHLTLDEIRSRLNDRLSLLVGPGRATLTRHRTMRAALEWSHELLDEREQRVFRRLAIFGGSFSEQGAIDVAAVEADVPAAEVARIVRSLVDRSLLAESPYGELTRRFRYLSVIGEFARERLAHAGELETASRRCADHLVALARAEIRDDGAPRDRLSVDRIRAEHANIMSILPWLIEASPSEALVLLDRISHPSTRPSLPGQMQIWLERALAGHTTRDATRAIGLCDLAQAEMSGNPTRIPAALSEAASIADELQDEILVGIVHHLRGYAMVRVRRYAEAIASWERALEILRRHDNPGRTASVAMGCALACHTVGDRARAWSEVEEASRALERFPASGGLRARVLLARADLAFREGDSLRAKHDLDEAIRAFPSALEGRLPRLFIDAAAHLAALVGDDQRAIQLAAAADRIGAPVGGAQQTHALADRSWIAPIEAKIGVRAAALRAAGSGLTLGEIVALATGGGPPLRAKGSLTRRELEVAQLVASGSTSAEIARQLGISDRTAENHVEHILVRLGLRSRAQIATWVAENLTARAAK